MLSSMCIIISGSNGLAKSIKLARPLSFMVEPIPLPTTLLANDNTRRYPLNFRFTKTKYGVYVAWAIDLFCDIVLFFFL